MCDVSRTSTKEMSHEQWLIERRKGIGGSDAAAVIGVSKYNSPYSLWLDKTGRVIPADISDKEAVRLGNDLEQYVADRWMESTGKKCRNCNAILRNSKYPFAHANPDRLVVGEKAGLECKTTSSYDVLEQCKNGFPECYYVQCVHYLMVTEYERWYLSVLVFGRGLYTFCLERSDVEEEIRALAESEREFWELVKNDTPPAIDGSDSTKNALNDMFAGGEDGVVDVTPLEANIKMLLSLKIKKAEIDEQIAQAENEIKEYLGNKEYGKSFNYTVSWKTTKGRETFDTKSFDKDYPNIRSNYIKVVNPTRRFTIKEN